MIQLNVIFDKIFPEEFFFVGSLLYLTDGWVGWSYYFLVYSLE